MPYFWENHPTKSQLGLTIFAEAIAAEILRAKNLQETETALVLYKAREQQSCDAFRKIVDAATEGDQYSIELICRYL